MVLDYYLNIKSQNEKERILRHLLTVISNGGEDDTNIFTTIYQMFFFEEVE